MFSPKGFIPAHGGYRRLFSYQKAEIIYDGTVYFVARFLQKSDRTIDQMVQAARSGKQNIAEASLASGTSKETEIKLTNVARASQEELLIDYLDFLRKNKWTEWPRDHPYAVRLNELHRIENPTYETYRKGIENQDPSIVCNVLIGLIRVTNFLLDKQIRRLEQDFLQNGGMRERMFQARQVARKNDRT
jgi:four helix bundle suffix protein